MKRYSLHLLLCVNAILALVLLWMWISPDGTLRNVRWQPPEPRKSDVAGLLPVLPAVGTADTRAFIAMLERPLFSATRRPPPPPPRFSMVMYTFLVLAYALIAFKVSMAAWRTSGASVP